MQEPKTKYIERLFNPDFRNELPNLTLIAYCVSNNGHICGYYQYKTRKVINVSHWMNDDEIEEFLPNADKYMKLDSPVDARRVRILSQGPTLLPESNNQKKRRQRHHERT